VLHRDLKPENILINESGVPKVADFGIAMLHGGSADSRTTGRLVGTVGYVAPEQQYLGRVDERSDQYSLAALAYEMLTGHVPLGLFKPPSAHRSEIRPEVDRVVLRALSEEPKERFPTVAEFREALDQGLAGTTAGFRRSAIIFPLAIALIGGLVFGLVTWLNRGTEPSKHSAAPAVPILRSPTPSAVDPLHKLTELRAYRLWVAAGKPTGEEGKAREREFWLRAEEELRKDVDRRAYAIWDQSGRPTGKQGEQMAPVNRDKAIRQLLQEAQAPQR
jgi:serine/threonine protein kinase